tara:strand:- start:2238 stop:2372 length:135 start_codon:yes stop_codon:yes gene_type:complete
MYFQTFNTSYIRNLVNNLDSEILEAAKKLEEFKRDLKKMKKIPL